ncbi:MAG: EutN/CcmL family microcompartment protein, partial [Planctomycetota bacterium]
DTVGAGEGELVYYVTAYEAVIPFFRPSVPIDCSLVGIIDSIDFHEKKTPAAPKPEKPKGTGKTKKVSK